MWSVTLKNGVVPEVPGYKHKPQWSLQEDNPVKPVQIQKKEQITEQLRTNEEQVQIHRLH